MAGRPYLWAQFGQLFIVKEGELILPAKHQSTRFESVSLMDRKPLGNG
jgi:hypothetical protein